MHSLCTVRHGSRLGGSKLLTANLGPGVHCVFFVPFPFPYRWMASCLSPLASPPLSLLSTTGTWDLMGEDRSRAVGLRDRRAGEHITEAQRERAGAGERDFF